MKKLPVTHQRPFGPGLDYHQARSRIQTGDVLLFQGTSRLSRFIRWGSRSAYSHAGMALWWNDRLMVVQSANRGVEVLPASTAVDRYDGQVDWWQPTEEVQARLNARALVDAAFDELGKPFAVLPLMALVVRMFRGDDVGHSDERYGTENYFCSQLVSRCYRKAGVDLVPDKADADTSPGDMARAGLLVFRGVLLPHPEGVAAHLLQPGEQQPDMDSRAA
jgi:cell wall-associated NlpC family hydrolase